MNVYSDIEPKGRQEDLGLLKKFFHLSRKLTDEERAEAVGVSLSTIGRWKREIKTGNVRPIADTNRAAIEEYNLAAELGRPQGDSARMVIQEMRAKLDELEARLPPATQPDTGRAAGPSSAKLARGRRAVELSEGLEVERSDPRRKRPGKAAQGGPDSL